MVPARNNYCSLGSSFERLVDLTGRLENFLLQSSQVDLDRIVVNHDVHLISFLSGDDGYYAEELHII